MNAVAVQGLRALQQVVVAQVLVPQSSVVDAPVPEEHDNAMTSQMLKTLQQEATALRMQLQEAREHSSRLAQDASHGAASVKEPTLDRKSAQDKQIAKLTEQLEQQRVDSQRELAEMKQIADLTAQMERQRAESELELAEMSAKLALQAEETSRARESALQAEEATRVTASAAAMKIEAEAKPATVDTEHRAQAPVIQARAQTPVRQPQDARPRLSGEEMSKDSCNTPQAPLPFLTMLQQGIRVRQYESPSRQLQLSLLPGDCNLFLESQSTSQSITIAIQDVLSLSFGPSTDADMHMSPARMFSIFLRGDNMPLIIVAHNPRAARTAVMSIYHLKGATRTSGAVADNMQLSGISWGQILWHSVRMSIFYIQRKNRKTGFAKLVDTLQTGSMCPLIRWADPAEQKRW